MDIKEAITSRWRYDDIPYLAPVKVAIDRTLDVYDAVRTEHGRVATDTMLSGLGRQDAIRKHVGEKLAPELRRTAACLKAAQAKIEAWRAKVQTPPAIDKTDAASASLRSELRQMIRGMREGARVTTLLDPNADPVLLTAVLEAPSIATGVQEPIRQQIVAAMAERNHPGVLARIERANEALQLLATANQVALNTIKAATDFPADDTLAQFLNGAVDANRAANIDDQANQEMAPLDSAA